MRSPVKSIFFIFPVVCSLFLLLSCTTASGEKFVPPVPDSSTLPSNDGGPDGCGSSRFACVMGGEAVLDRQTGLVWAKNTDILQKTVSWEDAVTFSRDAEIGGQRGWRMPTRDELISLLDTSRSRPALPEGHPFTKINEVGFGEKGCTTYWTSTEYEGEASAWIISFGFGQVMDSLKVFEYNIWPVRDTP